MKTGFGIFLLAAMTIGTSASAMEPLSKDFDAVKRSDYYDLHRDAASAYRNKKFDVAFAKFQQLACAGDKPSQATIGEMYLTGKGVERNDLIGYEWVKLASEYNFAAYNQFAKTIEDKLTPEQAALTGRRVETLRESYGLRATNMSCELRSSITTASNLNDAVQCTPESFGGAELLLHRCVANGAHSP